MFKEVFVLEMFKEVDEIGRAQARVEDGDESEVLYGDFD